SARYRPPHELTLFPYTTLFRSIPGLGKIRHNMHRCWPKGLSKLFTYAAPQLTGKCLTRDPPLAKNDEAHQCLAFHRMRDADGGCLAHRPMASQDRFDFGRPQPLAGHLDGVV